jgi:hypothetical protein
MAEKRQDDKNIFQGENVIVHKTVAQGGDVPSIGHVHEERDVPINSLAKALGYLVVGIALSALACWGLFEFFAAQADRADPQLSPLAERRSPPGPRLQSNPARDMAAFRRYEDSVIAASGVANDGSRRISVDDAMTMIAEKGLPRFVASGVRDTARGTMRDTAGAATTTGTTGSAAPGAATTQGAGTRP